MSSPDEPEPTTAPGRRSRASRTILALVRREFAAPAVGALEACRRGLTDPRHSRLRAVLLLGLAIRLILAPLTSWGTDTVGFVHAGEIVLYSGNPYSGGTWFNPPLAPFLASPTMGVVTLLLGPDGLSRTLPVAFPAALASWVPTVVPVPAALLAWKLPLLLADLAAAVALYYLVERYLAPGRGTLAATLWFLNPLTIWVSSVHGEVDGLAAAFALLALAAAAKRYWYWAGLLLSLSILAKGYTVVLVPAFLVGAAVLPGPWRPVLRRAAKPLAALAFGIATGLAIFFEYLSETFDLLATHTTAPVTYGGLSVLAIFNPASPKGTGAWAQYTNSAANAHLGLTVLQGFAVLTILLAVVLLVVRRRSGSPSGRSEAVRDLAIACAIALAGAVLANPVPNSENLDVFVAVGLAAALAIDTTRYWVAVWGIVLAGFFQYLALLTPFAFFYPLATWLGPGAVTAVNTIAAGYVVDLLLRGSLWELTGVVSGVLLLASVGLGLLQLARGVRLGRLRRASPAEGGA